MKYETCQLGGGGGGNVTDETYMRTNFYYEYVSLKDNGCSSRSYYPDLTFSSPSRRKAQWKDFDLNPEKKRLELADATHEHSKIRVPEMFAKLGN